MASFVVMETCARQKATASLTNRTEERLHSPWSISSMESWMSFFKYRFGSTGLSGHPFHPRPGEDPASQSSAYCRQPLAPK
jgi:hypothetical protein